MVADANFKLMESSLHNSKNYHQDCGDRMFWFHTDQINMTFPKFNAALRVTESRAWKQGHLAQLVHADQWAPCCINPTSQHLVHS